MYDVTAVPHLDFIELSEDSIRIRSNRYKVTQHDCHYDLGNILTVLYGAAEFGKICSGKLWALHIT